MVEESFACFKWKRRFKDAFWFILIDTEIYRFDSSASANLTPLSITSSNVQVSRPFRLPHRSPNISQSIHRIFALNPSYNRHQFNGPLFLSIHHVWYIPLQPFKYANRTTSRRISSGITASRFLYVLADCAGEPFAILSQILNAWTRYRDPRWCTYSTHLFGLARVTLTDGRPVCNITRCLCGAAVPFHFIRICLFRNCQDEWLVFLPFFTKRFRFCFSFRLHSSTSTSSFVFFLFCIKLHARFPIFTSIRKLTQPPTHTHMDLDIRLHTQMRRSQMYEIELMAK